MLKVPAVGDKLGRFRLEAILGQGGAGMVWRAVDEELDEVVCIKVLHPALANHPEMIGRFKRELVLARRLADPGICRLFDLHDEDGTRFLTMELVEGEVLREMLRGNKRLSVARTLVIIERLARALAAAHAAGIVHRDLKPQNIIVRSDDQPVILDFGVATALDVPGLTRPGVPLGTRHYIAPEVWKGEPATHLSDIYALGIILYNCLTARMPFSFGPTDDPLASIMVQRPVPLTKFLPHAPAELDTLFLELIQFEPKDRVQSASELAAKLARLAAAPDEGDEFALGETVPEMALPTAPKEDRDLGGTDDVTRPASRPISFDDGVEVSNDPIVKERPRDGIADDMTDDRSWVVGGKTGMRLALTDTGPPADAPPVAEGAPGPLPAEAATATATGNPRRTGALLLLALATGALLGALVLGFLGGDDGATDAPERIWADAPTDDDNTPPAGATASADAGASATDAGTAAAPSVANPAVDDAKDAGTASDAVTEEPEEPEELAAATAAVVDKPVTKPPRQRRTKRRRARRAPKPVAPAVSADEKRYETASAALASAQRSKGILTGDLPALSSLKRKMTAAAKTQRFDEAADRAEDARRMVAAAVIDEGFVRAKLARFNLRYDREKDAAKREKSGALMGQVLQDTAAGRFERANTTLNKAFRVLR